MLLPLEHEQCGKWFQSLFPCHLGTGASFGSIGQVDILQCGGLPAVVDAFLQLSSHLPLFGDGLDNRLLALRNLLQSRQPVADGSNLYLVKTTRPFLTVAGDKGDGTPLVQQFQGILYGMLLQVQLTGNQLSEYLQMFHIMMFSATKVRKKYERVPSAN